MKYAGCESAWTPERVQMMREMWIDGKSATEVAFALKHVTRNAVIGKIHRLGLSNSRPAASKPRGMRTAKRNRPVRLATYRPPQPANARPALRCVEVESNPVLFMDRGRDQCAFILDGYAETTCCGAAVQLSSSGRRLSNCPGHETLSHTGGQPRALKYDSTYGGARGRLSGIARRNLLPNDMREAA